MRFVALALVIVWAVGLGVMVFGAKRRRIYVNRRNLAIAAVLGTFAGIGWAGLEPAGDFLGKLGQVAWMSLVTMVLFRLHGAEHPDKACWRQQSWTFDLPDKVLSRLLMVGLVGTILMGFGVGPAHVVFWGTWEAGQRKLFVGVAVLVGLMIVVPIVIILTRRRRRPPGPELEEDKTAPRRAETNH